MYQLDLVWTQHLTNFYILKEAVTISANLFQHFCYLTKNMKTASWQNMKSVFMWCALCKYSIKQCLISTAYLGPITSKTFSSACCQMMSSLAASWVRTSQIFRFWIFGLIEFSIGQFFPPSFVLHVAKVYSSWSGLLCTIFPSVNSVFLTSVHKNLNRFWNLTSNTINVRLALSETK